MTEKSSIRFAIDTGGTFTDIVVVEEHTGKFTMDKVATTPEDTLNGVLNSIEKAKIDLTAIDRFFVHGSTTALNAMLERKGVRTAYVATAGFRDVPEIMRYNRPEMYNPKYRKPRPIVPRDLRFEVVERLNHRGEILIALDEDSVRDVARRLVQAKVESVAVCLLHSYRNGAHEQRVKEIIEAECPGLAVAISSTVAPEHREFERGTTTILNAYLSPVVERWVGNLERELVRRGFPGEIVLTKSDGGGMTAVATKRSPINMLLSGPAGGVIGGAHVAGISGYPNLITMDVGGTSYDVAMIRGGKASVEQETKIGDFPVLISNLDIRTIGAGGGSIAWIDSAGALHVGPQSAGAMPGPICYRRGGRQPTVTDAFLVCGYLDENNFLGGEMEIDKAGAIAGIKDVIADPLAMDVHDAASGILRIAMSNMAEATKDIVAEAGDDPRDYGMLCFGGGGPLFGAYLAEELSLAAILVPSVPSAFSAWGMLMVDLQHDVVRTVARHLDAMAAAEIESGFAELEARADALLAAEKVAPERRAFSRIAEMRYTGQEHSVAVPVALPLADDGAKAALFAEFERVYEGIYSYRLGSPADIVNLRVKAIGEIPKPRVREIAAGGGAPAAAQRGSRRAYDFLDACWQDFTVYARPLLASGNVIAGPALVEETTTTTIVRHDQLCIVDRFGTLIIKRKEEK